MTTSRSENREVACDRCGYHYRVRTMVAIKTGWVCEPVARCNSNIARQHWYRKGTDERV